VSVGERQDEHEEEDREPCPEAEHDYCRLVSVFPLDFDLLEDGMIVCLLSAVEMISKGSRPPWLRHSSAFRLSLSLLPFPSFLP
jgi:hypothetical protein